MAARASKGAAKKRMAKATRSKAAKAQAIQAARAAVPAGVDPMTGKTLSEADIQAIADRIIQGTRPQQRPKSEQPSKKRTYYARRPFGYENVELDREQVFRLVGAVNDEKLLRLGYIAVLPEDAELHDCGRCPAKFLTAGALNAHGSRRHAPPKPAPTMAPRQPDETDVEFEQRQRDFEASVLATEDQELEQEEKLLDQAAPLYLENSTASREG